MSGAPDSRRDFLKGLGLAAASTALPGRALAGPPEKDRPNIVFVMADDLGYGHLGCYGQRKIRTPNIDRLAAEGMRFTQFYAGFTVCAPSRSCLMTGLHIGHTPVRGNSGSASLLDDEITIAEVLKGAGYATAGFGKWGLGVEGTPGVPHRQGFDHFWGFYHQIHAHFYYPYWVSHNDEKVTLPGNRDGRRGRYVDDFLHEKAMDFIRASAAKGRPFFCYVPTIIPHVELAVPEDSAAPYRGKLPKVTINDPRRGYLGSDDAYATYAGMISRLDRNVGQIVGLLKELGIEERTLVIFTSDNGPQGGPWMPLREFFRAAGPLRGQKGGLFEGGIRVPFIARWPGRIRAGATSDHIGAFWDMMPTFAELAGTDAPRTDGISMVPALTGREDRQRKHAYLYWGRAIRAGRWKAHRNKSGRWSLYDLDKDIGETNDVAPAHPDVVAKIKQFAAEAYTKPRKQIGSMRVGIKDFVDGERIMQRNAR